MILDLRGLNYHVTIHGSPGVEPTVTFLHGFSGSGEDWEPYMHALRGAGYASLAIDLPGHGRTAAPVAPGRYTMAETVLDIDGVLATLSVERCHWVGYSMGGRVTLHVALAYPARVASLLLESVSPGIEGDAERTARRESDEALAREIEAGGVDWFAAYWSALPMFETRRTLPASVRAAVHARALRNDPRGLAGSLRGMGQGAQGYLGGVLSRIEAPTLLLAGELDPKYAPLAPAMAASLPHAEARIIPRAGHTIHLEEPEAFERALLDHLSAVESPAAAAVRT